MILLFSSVVTMLYYGITMNMSDLPGSPFLLVVISGGVELPGYLLCLVLLNRLGRRIMLSGSMILGVHFARSFVRVFSNLGAVTEFQN